MRGYFLGALTSIFIICVIYCGVKVTLERLIINNYAQREAGLLPDEWYWADRLYITLGVNNLMWGWSDFYRSTYPPEIIKILGNNG